MSDDEFREMVVDAIDGDVIDPTLLAHQVGCNLETLARWYRGDNAPHDVMREHVKAIIDCAQEFT